MNDRQREIKRQINILEHHKPLHETNMARFVNAPDLWQHHHDKWQRITRELEVLRREYDAVADCEDLLNLTNLSLHDRYRERYPAVTHRTKVVVIEGLRGDRWRYPLPVEQSAVVFMPDDVSPKVAPLDIREAIFENWGIGQLIRLAYAPEIDTIFVAH